MNSFSGNCSPSTSIRRSGTVPVISWYFMFSRVSTTVFPVLKRNSSLSIVRLSSSRYACSFYRVVGKITLFLIVTFMAVGEMSVFLAHIFFELASHLFRLWGWCLENGYISPLEFYNPSTPIRRFRILVSRKLPKKYCRQYPWNTAENTSSRPLATSYTGHPSILQIPHIRLYKLIVPFPCQVDFLTAGWQ